MRDHNRGELGQHIDGWRDCEAAGLKHRLVPAQRVGDATYWRCTRPSCPVTIRRTR